MIAAAKEITTDGTIASTMTAKELCCEARTLWLEATQESDLLKVEQLYRQALRAQVSVPQHQAKDKKKKNDKKTSTGSSKKRRRDREASEEANNNSNKLVMELSKKDYKDASNKLALLLCQQGRYTETIKGLQMLGYKCRLSSAVLNYTVPAEYKKKKNNEQLYHRATKKKCPSVIVDDFLSFGQHAQLKRVFGDVTSSYWTEHNYSIEPPSPYFSYAFEIPKGKAKDNSHGFLGELVDQIRNMPALQNNFPLLKQARYVELWAHNRPHASGHQMHFDSDDEGRGGVRNPIISTILYLSDSKESCGGPSLVTNQPFSGEEDEDTMELATHGWMAFPRPRRLVAFDGTLLHGVVPGKGVSGSGEASSTKTKANSSKRRRVTLMVAFWKELEIRPNETEEEEEEEEEEEADDKPETKTKCPGGAARALPDVDELDDESESSSPWAHQLLTTTVNTNKKLKQQSYDHMHEAVPLDVDCIYETLVDGTPWKIDQMGMPEYDQVFQGF
jgi:hypothetical protein